MQVEVIGEQQEYIPGHLTVLFGNYKFNICIEDEIFGSIYTEISKIPEKERKSRLKCIENEVFKCVCSKQMGAYVSILLAEKLRKESLVAN